MRPVNVLAVMATVLAGFVGSMTAAQAMTSADPLLGLELPLPVLTTPLPAGAPATELKVRYKADAKAPAQVWHLECDPPGGNHPRVEEACAALAEAAADGADPFAAPPEDQMCTFVYGGPQTAVVKGDWQGRSVNASFSRTNGCEISRWDAIEPVLSPAPVDAERRAR